MALGLVPQSVVSGVDPASVATSPVFESGFLRGLGQDIDVSRFSQAGVVVPGTYMLDITLNGVERLRQQVRVLNEGGVQRICFGAADARRWGAKLEELPDQARVEQVLGGDCVEAQALIPGATFSLDISTLSGALSIPQAYAGRVKRGYVDPSEWDEGITAGILGYHANAFRSERDGEASATDYNVNINSGLNVAGWRLRHNGNYRDSDDTAGKYSAQNTYAQTDIDALHSQLTLGEYFTPGSDFDSIPFTGVQLGSDDSMLPESERGFAPIVRGIAETNAKVTIRQNGNVVYETSVAPGAFVVDDLYATGYAGDLEVTVTEADGREKVFTVPFSAVVQMLRPGASRYNLALGHFRDDNLSDEPWFAQGTYRRGISNDLTLYGGGILADDYASLLAGAAFATPIGALAFDATASRAKGLGQFDDSDDRDENLNGSSYRISYSKRLNASRTNFSLAAYRFSSEGFLNFGDFARLREGDGSMALRERNRLQLSVSQPISGIGDFHFTGLARDYWGDQGSSSTFQVGYGRGFSWGYLNLTASRDLQDGESNDTFLLSASIPLGTGGRRSMLTTAATFDDESNSTVSTNLSGSLGEHSELNYGVYAKRSDGAGDSSNNYGANLGYRTSATRLAASYSQGEGYRQYSASASGTVVAHAGGLVFSPEQGETMALLVAEGASGAAVGNGLGNRLDADGEALSSGLTPYRHNQVSINPKGLPMDVELEATSQNAVPRRGAVVRLDYATISGKPLLLRVLDSQVPFGASVVDAENNQVAMVGQGGLIFLRGEHEGLKVVWGQAGQLSCKLHYQVSQVATDDTPYEQVDAHCPPAG
ncbi:fimbria/pilus outer membrane usher protein [Pseudomonas sp. AOB-7]|uniref:fimbria/pilus outer membrane usher protein n=1 Tax=Pseudomonas sp. AOB-7 TaxID=2482750 RepID=UPI002115840F|nr:fimbria/pilus outer membrane usher protein [Pseudomonas sp. AOB-7]